MRESSATPPGELEALALAKMSAVLGADRARTIADRVLARLGIQLATPQDLLHFADEVTKLGGFEGAVGAMLGVAAVMRGARKPLESVPSSGSR